MPEGHLAGPVHEDMEHESAQFGRIKSEIDKWMRPAHRWLVPEAKEWIPQGECRVTPKDGQEEEAPGTTNMRV